MRRKRTPIVLLSGSVTLFFFLAFLLLAVRNGEPMGYILTVTVPLMILAGTHLLPRLFPADRLLLSLTNFLCALGILLLYDTRPSAALQQVISYGIGLLAMIVCIYLVRTIQFRAPVLWFLIAASAVLISLPLLLGSEINGAKSWLFVGGISFQPSEVVKISLIIVLSYFLSRHEMIPWLGFVVFCLGILMLQKDLGTALMYYGTTLLLFWSSDGNWFLTLLGLAGGGGAAAWGYQHFAHVRLRVRIWLNPWRDKMAAGYQLIQGLVAIASGGLFGVGLGLGTPTAIPVYESDFIFAVLCEQFGLVFGACVLLMFVALIWRGATIAMAARRSFYGYLAMGPVIMIGIQTFVIIGGVLKLIPLTGVTLPFISYGGTSLISSMCLMGLVQGVESLNEDHLAQDIRVNRLETGR